jgi:CDGSH iron-sulfur domain-containing protein 3
VGDAGGPDGAGEVVIKVRANGPYRVTGPVRLVDHEGRPIATEGADIVLCRCGRSATKPFCDLSHRDGAGGPAGGQATS